MLLNFVSVLANRILNWAQVIVSNVPQFACQVLFIVALAIASARLFGSSREKVRDLVKKYCPIFLIIVLIAYIIKPYSTLTAGVNLLFIECSITIIAILYSKVKNFKPWLNFFIASKSQMVYFWSQLLKNPIRAICIVVFFCTMCSNWIEIVALALIMLVASNMLANRNFLEKIDWSKSKVQSFSTGLVALIAISGVLKTVGALEFIANIFATIVIAIGIIVGVSIILMVTKENENKNNSETKDGNNNNKTK
jgi:hypothetical protein